MTASTTKSQLTGLNQRLSATKAEMVSQMPEQALKIMGDAAAELAASRVADSAVQVGEKAPEFTLMDATGTPYSLAAMCSAGPVVVSFFRGGWCPFCGMEMRTLSERRGDMETLGATVVAISLQVPSASAATEADFSPGFPLLVDEGAKVIKQYGLGFMVNPDLNQLYKGFGIDLNAANGYLSHYLPIPATYVIGRDGMVVAAHVNVDYTTRMEPEAILEALRTC